MIHVLGGSGDGLEPPLPANIKKASEEWNTKYSTPQSHVVSMSKAHWGRINNGTHKGQTHYNGCAGHYNFRGQRLLMKDILPDVRKILGIGI